MPRIPKLTSDPYLPVRTLSPTPQIQACITTRKGNKRFAVFDFAVTLGWEGSLEGAAGTVGRDNTCQ